MKLNKTFQGVLEIVAVMSIILIGITIDSDWTSTYLMFLIINLLLAFGSITLLAKFGRFE